MNRGSGATNRAAGISGRGWGMAVDVKVHFLSIDRIGSYGLSGTKEGQLFLLKAAVVEEDKILFDLVPFDPNSPDGQA